MVLFRSELIQNSPTEINLLHGIFNRRNCGTEDYYIFTIKHINSMYAFFDSPGHVIQGLVILIEDQKTFG